jgi:hypothetical protein
MPDNSPAASPTSTTVTKLAECELELFSIGLSDEEFTSQMFSHSVSFRIFLQMRYSVAALRLVLTASLLSACSRFEASDSTTSPNESVLIEQIASHCTDLDAPELGDGKLCIDNGFRVTADDFSFANWGRSQEADSNVTVQTLIDLFGHSAVCIDGPQSQCVLRPTTTQKLEEWNNALAGGRCEGLSTLSTRFFLKLDEPSQFRTSASRVADLKRNDKTLSSSIVYWWATQFLTEVSDRAATSRRQSPLQLVDNLIQGLANGVGYTVGLYFGSSGHSVTPFAVTKRDAGFVIHVYDNNTPGIRREIVVDSRTNTWSYDVASSNPNTKTTSWSGRTGAIELTPMSARQGPFECSFCTTVQPNDPTIITLASRDPQAPGYLSVVTRNGKRIEASPTSVLNEIDGAEYRVSKGATSGLVTVVIPHSITDFDVEVRRGSSVVPAGDVVVNMRRPSMPSIQVSGNLAHGVIGATTSSLLAVRKEATSIMAPLTNSARVSIAAGSGLTRTELATGLTLLIKQISRESIEVALKGANGSVISSTELDASQKQSVSEITLARSNEGSLVITRAVSAPVPVMVQPTVNFTPGRAPTTSSSTVPSSIVIALPD